MTKKALVTGITGQDGVYLAKLLLEKGYDVYGAVRRSSTGNIWRLKELGIDKEINLVSLELLEQSNIIKTISSIEPDEVYNLGAQSFVRASFDQPIYTSEVTALSTLKILEAIRIINPKIKFYQASSSEMFGLIQEKVQKETTKFYPRSPYACAKVFAHNITINYRESYDIFGSCGILFNHESPLRGEEFVTRKISTHLARMATGEDLVLELGNFEAKRDWGFAGDFVEAMHLMLQHDKAEDYVVATGIEHSVEEFLLKTAEFLDMKISIQGEGLGKIAVNEVTNKVIAKVNPIHFRPAEVDTLLGDYSKATELLNWKPKMSFEELVISMAKEDYDRAKKGWFVR